MAASDSTCASARITSPGMSAADKAEAARLDAQAAEYTRLGLEAARQGRGTDAFRLREQAYWASKDASDIRAGTATSRQRRLVAAGSIRAGERRILVAPELVLPRQRTLASFKRRDVRNTIGNVRGW